MRRRRWLLIGLVLVLIVVSGAILLISRAPQVSSVEVQSCIASGDSCLRFPSISGDNLPGDAFSLPVDFAGQRNLVIVPFDEDQQVKAAGWLPLAQEIAAAHDGFAYYSLPIFPDMAAPMRALIRTGMSFTVPADLRALTITAFLDDRDAFLAALDIPDTDAMQVFLLDGEGVVLWRGAGDYDAAQGDALRAVMG